MIPIQIVLRCNSIRSSMKSIMCIMRGVTPRKGKKIDATKNLVPTLYDYK